MLIHLLVVVVVDDPAARVSEAAVLIRLPAHAEEVVSRRVLAVSGRADRGTWDSQGYLLEDSGRTALGTGVSGIGGVGIGAAGLAPTGDNNILASHVKA